MSQRPCAAPIAFPALVDYWLGELAGDREQALEEHLFACGYCAARLEELARLGAGVRAVFGGGGVGAVVSDAFVEKLKRAGLRVREYRVAPGESVSCTISAADDFMVGRLSADLSGVKRLDVLDEVEGRGRLAMQDVPFDAAAGEVLLCPPAALLRKMPAHVDRIRLIAVDEAGERTLGEYTFVHTPS